MKIILTVGVVLAVLIGITKLRKREEADHWHEVTAH